ncbi:DUF2793 domain-containing protein [Lysobacter fragariae]
MSNEPKTGLPLWPAGATQQDFLFNALLRMFATAGFRASVLDKDLSAPPAHVAGNAYIIGPSPTGEWASKTNQIAYSDGVKWWYYVPAEGWKISVLDEDVDYRFNGSAWVNAGTGFQILGYIDGLRLEWVSNTSIRATSGTAYLESLGRYVNSASSITKSSLSLSASTWYHVYLYLNSGTPDIEIVTTAPASPYHGVARSKTSDTSRRYLGSVLTDASGNVTNFLQINNRVQWRINAGIAPFRVLNGGTATTATTVSLSGVVPVTSRMAQIRLINTATNAAALQAGTSDDSSSGVIAAINPTSGTVSQAFLDFPADSSQAILYKFNLAPTGGSAFVDVYGYTYER